MLEVFIYVVIGTIISHDMIDYFVSVLLFSVLTLFVRSTDIFCKLQTRWARIYETRDYFYSWGWYPKRAPYLLDTCLDGLQNMRSFLSAPWTYANWGRGFLWVFTSWIYNPSLWGIFMNSPCYPLAMCLILNLRVGSVWIIGRISIFFLWLELVVTSA